MRVFVDHIETSRMVTFRVISLIPLLNSGWTYLSPLRILAIGDCVEDN